MLNFKCILYYVYVQCKMYNVNNKDICTTVQCTVLRSYCNYIRDRENLKKIIYRQCKQFCGSALQYFSGSGSDT